MGKIKDNALISVKVATGDLSGAEGKLVALGVNGATLSASATVPAAAVITEADDGSGTVGVAVLGSYRGTVHMKAGGNVTEGSALVQMANGCVQTGTAGVVVGIAVESAKLDELFEAAPVTPVTRA